ncbi:MAG TPA: DUF6265 family protein [Ignavibacteria bacterium]|nr:DUF6265 family protein [Ignavibacteria bacterium]
MKTIIIILITLFFNMKSDNLDFDFLIGKWVLETKKGFVYEEWEKVSDTLFKGKSYNLSDDIITPLESIELVKIDNDYFYIPTVINQNEGKPIKFRLVSSDKDIFVFENLEHDFPQRIIYQKSDGLTLYARIEGYNGDFSKGSEFRYKKAD